MKIQITFKDPDGVSESLRDAAKLSAASVKGIDDEEREQLEDTRREEMEEQIKPWVQYGEYLTVIFDTDAKTATVVPVR